MKRLTKDFFERSTLEIAKNLLGCYLIHKTKEGRGIGKIVETEAYLKDDPASHSFNGKTKRNEAMFMEAGKAYVYFTYGMYFCFNVVTNKKGIGEAVLIRALEPISGIETMKKKRKISEISNLCNGPAKLVEAMGIKKKQNGISLLKGNLRIEKGENVKREDIGRGKRIGISKGTDLEHRFFIKECEFLSRKE